MTTVPPPHPAFQYKEPLAVKAGRYTMSVAIVVGVLLVLYIAGWFTTAMMLRSAIQDWFSMQAQAGYLAQYDDEQARLSGFPFQVKATLADVVLGPKAGENDQRDWVWSPEKVVFRMTALPWTIRTVRIDLSAQQQLNLGSQKFSGHAEVFDVTFDWLSKGIPSDMKLEIQKLMLTQMKEKSGFEVKRLSAVGERLSNGNYRYDIAGEELDLPFYIRGLGRHFSEILLRGELTENFAREGFEKSDLVTWRDNGGTLEATRLQIGYGPLFLQGNGTLALDRDMQPIGAFTARIQGFFETLERLQRGGIVRRKDVTMARVVLGMLAKQPKNGGPAVISLPLSIQDLGFYAGPVKLADMKPINW